MTYYTLTKYEQDNAVVSHYIATELSIYIHTINAERYEKMLATGGLSRRFRKRIGELFETEKAALAENIAVAEGTRPQLPEPHIVRAIVAARTAEMAMQSGAPRERAMAMVASDPAYAETVPTIGLLRSMKPIA